MVDYWWHIFASTLGLLITLWGCGLVAAAVYYRGNPGPYFRWTRRAIGWFIQTPFRVARNLLIYATAYLWRHWRREIVWFLLGAVTASLAFRHFGMP